MPEAELETSESPGHFERILSQLGETDLVMLKRAAAIDLAGEQLMIGTARVGNRSADLSVRPTGRNVIDNAKR